MKIETSNNEDLYAVWLDHKLKEFRRQGYSEITVEDLWDYCINFLWKHKEPNRYYQKVNDIASISLNDYFNYASLKAQVYNVTSLDEMELDDLLK
ncbi:hypothetical protein GCM10008929_00750 [Alkalibacterium psychrotolerans]